MFDKKFYEDRIEALQKSQEVVKERFHAIDGAISEAKYMLELIDLELIDKAAAQEVSAKEPVEVVETSEAQGGTK